jgi:hypothetical protein
MSMFICKFCGKTVEAKRAGKFCPECDITLDYVWQRSVIHPNYLQIRDAVNFITRKVHAETGEHISNHAAAVVWGIFTFAKGRP